MLQALVFLTTLLLIAVSEAGTNSRTAVIPVRWLLSLYGQLVEWSYG